MKTRMLFVMGLAALLTLCVTGGTMAQDFRNFSIGGINLVALADVPKASPAASPRTQLLVGLPSGTAVTGADMLNSVNMFVLKTAAGNYLFDTGNGGRSAGLVPSLAAAGLRPDDITAIVLTHFHGDHIGGLMDGRRAAFPNATLYVPRVEMEKGPSSASFAAAYAGRTAQFDWGDEVLPGVRAMDASGHTNGHTVYMIENGADKLFVAGDLIHFGGVQLPNPDIAVTYDTDTAKAIASRRKFFDMVAAEGLVMASMHLPFPAVGTLAKAGAGYTFTPRN